MVAIDIKLALRGFQKFIGYKSKRSRTTGAIASTEPHQGTLPPTVQSVFHQKAGLLTERDGRDILVVYAALGRLPDLPTESLTHMLLEGELNVSTLENFFHQPELEFEQEELLRVLRQTRYFKLVANPGVSEDLPTYELAQLWIKNDHYWAVEKLLEALPQDPTPSVQRYIRTLIACSPLPSLFRVPVRLAIEIALLSCEKDNQGFPRHDLENKLRAQLYNITPAAFIKDTANLALTDYRNERLRLLNHSLISHQGALQVHDQIVNHEIPELLACNVLSSLVRIGSLHSDDLLMQMADTLQQRRVQQPQTKTSKWVANG